MSQSNQPVQPTTPEQPTIGGMPVAQLRAILNQADDNLLQQFLHGYAIGLIADMLIVQMVRPSERANFIAGLANTWPDDWKAALEQLK